VLYEAALREGAKVRFSAEVQALDELEQQALVTTSEGDELFDLFIIADGAASRLRTASGLAGTSSAYRWGALWGQFWVPEWTASDLLLQRYRGTSQMMGLMPTEVTERGVRLSLFWSLRRDRHAEWREAPIDEWTANARALWPEAEPVLAQIQSHDDVAFAVYRHSWPRTAGRPPYVLVGDSLHAASPQLGLGTTLAVQDALALVHCVHQAGPAEGVRAYEQARLQPARVYQTLSRVLTPCFQGDRLGLVRDVAFAVGRRVPGVPWAMKRSIAY
jgi:2-polyprenyl-6-methoxyphenol hydroxylase-like FAD-dependent oxidoreductase